MQELKFEQLEDVNGGSCGVAAAGASGVSSAAYIGGKMLAGAKLGSGGFVKGMIVGAAMGAVAGAVCLAID